MEKRRRSVTVVGGVNVDIGGRPFRPLIPRDSNPGTVRVSLGGVGRNIAHNAALLKIPVRFLTAFGIDSHALAIEASCAELQIDIHRARKVPGISTSTYLYLSDEEGNMVLAVSDMEICRLIDAAYLAEQQDILDRAEIVASDTNIPEESVRYLADHVRAPLFFDPVSVAKAGKLRSCLDRIHTLKPNLAEAEALSGVPITDRDSIVRAGEALLEMGLTRVFISAGADGVYAAEDGHRGFMPSCPAHPVNATGAGDSFMAGLIYAYLEGMNLRDTAAFAAAAAALTVESEETVNPDLSPDAVWERAGEAGQWRAV